MTSTELLHLRAAMPYSYLKATQKIMRRPVGLSYIHKVLKTWNGNEETKEALSWVALENTLRKMFELPNQNFNGNDRSSESVV